MVTRRVDELMQKAEAVRPTRKIDFVSVDDGDVCATIARRGKSRFVADITRQDLACGMSSIRLSPLPTSPFSPGRSSAELSRGPSEGGAA